MLGLKSNHVSKRGPRTHFLSVAEQGLRQSWWCHQMGPFSALLAICAGNSQVSGEFPAQRPVTWSFDVFFDLRVNKRLSKQSWGWWIEMLSRSLWRHRNEWGRMVARYLYCSLTLRHQYTVHLQAQMSWRNLDDAFIWEFCGVDNWSSIS